MSKTYIYSLAVILLFVLVINPLQFSGSKKEEKEDSSDDNMTGAGVPADESRGSGTGLSENKDENGVSQGAAGQQKYRIGLRGHTN